MRIFIDTKPFGKIEIDEKQIIDFPDGIFGFEFEKKFVILDSKEHSPFKWMQAYSEPSLAFVIIRPIDFLIKYELSISQSDMESVKAIKPDDLLVFAIVTIPADPSQMTANLQGPIIINTKDKIGRQVISLSDKYRVKHKILEEMKQSEKELR